MYPRSDTLMKNIEGLILETFLGTLRTHQLLFIISKIYLQIVLSLELNILASFGYK